jgi:hypothetical protein
VFETICSLSPLGDDIQKRQLVGFMHHLDLPSLKPEPVCYQSSVTLYAHGFIGHVHAGQNLAVLVETIA